MKLVAVLLALQGLPTFLIACAFVFQRSAIADKSVEISIQAPMRLE